MLTSSKTLPAANQVRPRDTSGLKLWDISGRETLLALNFWTLPAARHFWPWSFWTHAAPKFLDKSGPKTSPALRQVRPQSAWTSPALRQVLPWDKSCPETSPALRQIRPQNNFGFKTSCTTFNYRKVVSRSTCYFSGNQVFGSATNQDMSLNETCFYS